MCPYFVLRAEVFIPHHPQPQQPEKALQSVPALLLQSAEHLVKMNRTPANHSKDSDIFQSSYFTTVPIVTFTYLFLEQTLQTTVIKYPCELSPEQPDLVSGIPAVELDDL